MLIKKDQIPILIVNLCFLSFFTVLFLSRKNYEFLMYIGVIIFFLLVIIATNQKVNYSNPILWGLTLWAFLHMAGGGFYINGIKLYEVILFPISKDYHIFRYDQFVHIIGFGAATLVMYAILKPILSVGPGQNLHGMYNLLTDTLLQLNCSKGTVCRYNICLTPLNFVKSFGADTH